MNNQVSLKISLYYLANRVLDKVGKRHLFGLLGYAGLRPLVAISTFEQFSLSAATTDSCSRVIYGCFDKGCPKKA